MAIECVLVANEKKRQRKGYLMCVKWHVNIGMRQPDKTSWCACCLITCYDAVAHWNQPLLLYVCVCVYIWLSFQYVRLFVNSSFLSFFIWTCFLHQLWFVNVKCSQLSNIFKIKYIDFVCIVYRERERVKYHPYYGVYTHGGVMWTTRFNGQNDESQRNQAMPAHNLSFTVLGVSRL